jgi:hypothetical protein
MQNIHIKGKMQHVMNMQKYSNMQNMGSKLQYAEYALALPTLLMHQRAIRSSTYFDLGCTKCKRDRKLELSQQSDSPSWSMTHCPRRTQHLE